MHTKSKAASSSIRYSDPGKKTILPEKKEIISPLLLTNLLLPKFLIFLIRVFPPAVAAPPGLARVQQ